MTTTPKPIGRGVYTIFGCPCDVWLLEYLPGGRVLLQEVADPRFLIETPADSFKAHDLKPS